MEGVTDPAFRAVVLDLHDSSTLGGAFTEFVRVVDHPLPTTVLKSHLTPLSAAGDRVYRAGRADISPSATPVGLQLMGSDLGSLAETARRAAAIPVPVLDLNFGCPAKGALRSCAGSAMLKDPKQVFRVVAAVTKSVDRAIPVTAKIRAGYNDDRLLEDLARAAEDGGASLLTVHARTRAEGYQPDVDWTRIERAVRSVSIPVCGNGGIRCHADLQRMRDETGCAYVMVGQAALADPWIFSGRDVSPERAARFLWDYSEALAVRNDAPASARVKRVKQLVRTYQAGSLVDENRRHRWLREQDPNALLAEIADCADRDSTRTA